MIKFIKMVRMTKMIGMIVIILRLVIWNQLEIMYLFLY